MMYINAFWFGVLMCIVSEIVLVIVIALINGLNSDTRRKEDSDDDKD